MKFIELQPVCVILSNSEHDKNHYGLVLVQAHFTERAGLASV